MRAKSRRKITDSGSAPARALLPATRVATFRVARPTPTRPKSPMLASPSPASSGDRAAGRTLLHQLELVQGHLRGSSQHLVVQAGPLPLGGVADCPHRRLLVRRWSSGTRRLLTHDQRRDSLVEITERGRPATICPGVGENDDR